MTHSPTGVFSLKRALWANAALLAVIAATLLTRGGSSWTPSLSSPAYGQQMPIGGAGVFIVPGQFSDHTYGCYLMDVDAQTLCAYQYYPADKQLNLVAARNFRYDRRLPAFNTGTPSPDEVERLVQKMQNDARVKQQNNAPAEPEEKKN